MSGFEEFPGWIRCQFWSPTPAAAQLEANSRALNLDFYPAWICKVNASVHISFYLFKWQYLWKVRISGSFTNSSRKVDWLKQHAISTLYMFIFHKEIIFFAMPRVRTSKSWSEGTFVNNAPTSPKFRWASSANTHQNLHLSLKFTGYRWLISRVDSMAAISPPSRHDHDMSLNHSYMPFVDQNREAVPQKILPLFINSFLK